MNIPWHEFHLLRPLCLLALVPGILVALAMWRRRDAGAWQQVIDAELLSSLLTVTRAQRRRSAALLFLLAWTLAVLALAGPTWSRLPQAVQQSTDALVLILDLSPSMNAGDLAPSRVERARRKIHDILARRDEGLTALIAFSGDAHVVAPLTDDTRTIAALLPALTPDIMPVSGDQFGAALELASELVSNAGIAHSGLLLLTDGLPEEEIDRAKRRLERHQQTLHVLGVGTRDGAPVPGADGNFQRDARGGVNIARLDETGLRELAKASGGGYQHLRVDDQDIEALVSAEAPWSGADNLRETRREFDLWQDQGGWLLLLVLPLAALAFRRGWLLALPLLLMPPTADADIWRNLWLTPDQQGARALLEQDPERAAGLFNRPDWRGSALYQSGDYDGAAEAFTDAAGAVANYNLGNALARAGRLEDALQAYRQALAETPDFEDAEHNRQLVEDLLRQQQEQQQQQQQQQQQDGQESGTESPQDGEESNSDTDEGDGSQQSPGDQATDEQEDGKPPPAEAGNDDANAEDADSEQQEPGEQQDRDSSAEESGDQAAAPTGPDANQESITPGELAAGEESGDAEQQQALEQWLRRIPDDPAGLLRRKFQDEYQQRQRTTGKR